MTQQVFADPSCTSTVAWYHHREVFDICESETSLYERFLALSHEYDLVSPDLLVIPSQKQQREQEQGQDAARHDEQGHGHEEEQASPPSSSSDEEEEEDGKHADRAQAGTAEIADAAPAVAQADRAPDQTGAVDAESQPEPAGDVDAQAPAKVDAELDSDQSKEDKPKTDNA